MQHPNALPTPGYPPSWFQRLMLLIIAGAAASATAQPADQIAPRTNPAPVPLRRIWAIHGNDSEAVGPVVSLPDINGDGVKELGVYAGVSDEWTTRWKLRVFLAVIRRADRRLRYSRLA